ncbi:MAG: spermine/spermidine synthase [Chloroflexi bacterium]|nr:spermine/spermidine synthase [Chloroflexota bacterium]
MNPQPQERVVLARHTTPSGEIQLQQRRWDDGSTAFEIISDGVFPMASYNQISERALARHSLAELDNRQGPEPRMLIGGLGMGFTLQETLDLGVESVDVVEISPYIIEWNRSHFAVLNGNALADPRVTIIHQDLYLFLTALSHEVYDAILLDVDNGPSWLAHEKNGQLYTLETLRTWSELLKSGGVFAIWSAQAEPAFLRNMDTVFTMVEEIPIVVQSHRKEPVEHFLYRGINT